MKRVLCKVILPALAIGIWVLTCYPVCNKAEGFDFFLFWILVGFPFGIRKMCMVLIPKKIIPRPRKRLPISFFLLPLQNKIRKKFKGAFIVVFKGEKRIK